MGFPSTAPYMGAPNSVTDPNDYYQQAVLSGQEPGYGMAGPPDPFEVLVKTYSAGGDTPAFRAYAQQQGFDPQQVIDTTNQRMYDYNRGGLGGPRGAIRNFLKDAGGVAGLFAGGLAASGGFAGAGAAGAGGSGLTGVSLPAGVGYLPGGTATLAGSAGGAAGGLAGAGAGGLESATLAPYAAGGGSITGSVLPAAKVAANGLAGLGVKDWIGLGGNLLGGLAGAQAAKEATNASTAADQAAIGEIRRQFDLTRSDQAPYQAAGVNALGQLSDPNANFAASPDYGFRRSEGMRDIGNSFSARGGAQSGNALKALADYNSSLASGEFGNWWNRQAGLAGIGQTANAQTGTFGANAANNISGLMNNQGNTRASGVLGRYGSVYGGLSDALNNWLYRHP